MQRILLAVVIILGTGRMSAGQTQAYATGLRTVLFEADVPVLGVDLTTGRVLWQADSSHSGRVAISGGIVVTADGQYVAWPAAKFVTGAPLSDHALVIRDSLTGRFLTVPIAGQPIRVLAHPRRLAVYLVYSTNLVEVISPTGREALHPCQNNRDAALSADGSQLSIACAENKVVVLSTPTLTVVQTVSTQDSVLFIAVNRAGSHFAVATRSLGDRFDSLVVYQVASGSETARLRLPVTQNYADARVTLLRADVSRQRLYASALYSNTRFSFTDVTLVLDFDTLTTVGAVLSGFHDISFGSDGARAIGLRVTPMTFLNTSVRPYAIDTQTLQLSVLADSFYGGNAAVATADAPLAPTGAQAVRTGRRVTFTWALPPQSLWVTSWELEARMSEGGPVVASLSIGPDQHPLHIDNVPAGTYVVRLRGVNAVGAGAWSAPITVIVP